MADEITQAVQNMREYLEAQSIDIVDAGDEEIRILYGAGGGGSILINMHELAAAALSWHCGKDGEYEGHMAGEWIDEQEASWTQKHGEK